MIELLIWVNLWERRTHFWNRVILASNMNFDTKALDIPNEVWGGRIWSPLKDRSHSILILCLRFIIIWNLWRGRWPLSSLLKCELLKDIHYIFLNKHSEWALISILLVIDLGTFLRCESSPHFIGSSLCSLDPESTSDGASTALSPAKSTWRCLSCRDSLIIVGRDMSGWASNLGTWVPFAPDWLWSLGSAVSSNRLHRYYVWLNAALGNVLV